MAGTLSYVDVGDQPSGRFQAPYLVRLWIADQLRLPSVRLSLAEVERVRVGRGEALGNRRVHEGMATLQIEIPDGWMSREHVELSRSDGSWTLRDAGSKNGCFVNGVRVEQRLLEDGDVLMAGNTLFLFRDAVDRSHAEPADQDSDELHRLPLVQQSLSLPLARMFSDLAKVAASQVPLILHGETGTGKELTARFVHQQSRRPGAFVAVNCGAIPANLVESELFGHRKGAFSGATADRMGLVMASDGGTLFLDEIAELSLEAQVKLLRVLQEREVLPVGATRPIAVDLRVVAASHEDLSARVAAERFRGDLLARLSGVQFELPPLRERREDLGILLRSFLAESSTQEIQIEREASMALALFEWPRNIRELEQVMKAAAAWGEPTIGLAQLPPGIAAVIGAARGPLSGDDELRQRLIQELRKHQGNVSAVARDMGKARVQIRRWCKRFALDPESFR